MIYVCNKKTMRKLEGNFVVVNIMRPSILSNDWSHNPNTAASFIVGSRKEAVEKYEEYFLKMVKKEGDFRNEVIKLFKMAQEKDIYLMCCCKPSFCHGDIIKKFLITMLKDKLYIDKKEK